MRIQHNIPALSAYRNYTRNVSMVNKNLEKLSSGYKINRAGDDAAGLAISEKMRVQISGLEQAQNNAKAGINLVQTAEGALTEVHDMLNRMYTLAEQSANGTYADDVDREQLQKEIVSLRNEINRIADATNYNGIKLLDGSLEDGENKTITGEQIDVPILGAEKAASWENVGTGTILHKSGADATGTEIQAELHNAKVEGAAVGDTITMTIGAGTDSEKAITLTVVANDAADVADGEIKINDAADSEALATAFRTAFGADATIKGQAFTVGGTGTSIKFTQTTPPTDSDQVVSAALPVTITYTANGVAPAAVDVTNAKKIAGEKAVAGADWANTITSSNAGNMGNVTAPASGGITQAKILEAINKVDASASATAGQVKVEYGGDADGPYKGKMVLKVGTTVIGVSDDEITAIGTGDTGTFSFVDVADGETNIGSIAIAGANGNATTETVVKNANYTIDDLAITAGKTVTFTGTEANLETALDGAAGADQAIKVQYNTDKWEISAGGKTIEATAEFDDTNGTITLKDAEGNALLTATTADMTEALYQAAFATAQDTGFTYSAAVAAGGKKGTFNVSTTMNTQGAMATDDQLASTKFDLTADLIKDGQTLTIGQKQYTFAVGADSIVDTTGTDVIDLKAYEVSTDPAKLAELVDAAGIALSQKSDANADFTISYNQEDNKVAIHEKNNSAYANTGDLASVDAFQKLVYANKAGTTINGTKLTLQIGDTADDYNKIGVSIKDMHDVGMGIAEIDISDQQGASDAMDAIKDAVNYVSDVRGDLGALQNRLDHTINNLSVTQENITDAESTIRDVDIAKEMMAYTKNNILVQSAQAMLAQANQLPQGVLQLLG